MSVDARFLIAVKMQSRLSFNFFSKHRMCREFVVEFVSDVAVHASQHSMRYHEPEYLPPIDLRVENRRRRYEEGKLHHLSQSVSFYKDCPSWEGPRGGRTRSQSYKQNSIIVFDSTLELTNQISHVTNFSLFDWSIPA